MKKETRVKVFSVLFVVFNLGILAWVKINFGQQAFDIGCGVAGLITFWLGRKFFTGGAL